MVTIRHTNARYSSIRRSLSIERRTFTFFLLHVVQPALDFLCGRLLMNPAVRRTIEAPKKTSGELLNMDEVQVGKNAICQAQECNKLGYHDVVKLKVDAKQNA
jgi:hypothetical protein